MHVRTSLVPGQSSQGPVRLESTARRGAELMNYSSISAVPCIYFGCRMTRRAKQGRLSTCARVTAYKFAPSSVLNTIRADGLIRIMFSTLTASPELRYNARSHVTLAQTTSLLSRGTPLSFSTADGSWDSADSRRPHPKPRCTRCQALNLNVSKQHPQSSMPSN